MFWHDVSLKPSHLIVTFILNSANVAPMARCGLTRCYQL